MNNIRNGIAVVFCAALAACAQFEHQTSESEPHALVTIRNRPELAEATLQSLDGIPVKGGATYRVRPGAHRVGIECKDIVTIGNQGSEYGPRYSVFGTETANVHLSGDGRSRITNEDPFAHEQSVTLSAEDRRFQTRHVTIHVKAGERYELTENLMDPCRHISR